MMTATYRLQLQPGFGFPEVQSLLPYFRRLGISHLYLSPITDARSGSTHGYDVVDHNRIRDELGGPDAFWQLLRAARRLGLSLILDIVPNHAGVGSRNTRWQDVLAYGPHSPYAQHFDINWQPLKPELRWKILLPFLEAPYGETLDRREIVLTHEEGRISATYRGIRFALAPATYADVLAATVEDEERARGGNGAASAVASGEPASTLRGLAEALRRLHPSERGRADALRTELAAVADRVRLRERLAAIDGRRLHAILEQQFWRLSSWRTAADEINYRRFFDVNDLVGLRMERADVFTDAHRLLARLATLEGIEGVRVDHVDGLFDPQTYLERLRRLRVGGIWVEKILAPGETLPPDWPVEGTSGYDFMHDAINLLVHPDGADPLLATFRRFVGNVLSYREEVFRSKQLVMKTALAGELYQLASGLDRISEGDYHTRDFTFEALRSALADIVAVVSRYRTYLPHDREDAERLVREALHEARQRRTGVDPTVYAFIGQVLTGAVDPSLQPAALHWTGRFQQYTAPVAAKGVEDTAFYRWVRLVALNEVGCDPERFGMTPHAFHARARFRALRYPRNLLATATHDHKRGEDMRMRLAVLAELPVEWQRTVTALARVARRHRGSAGPSRTDEFLFYQTLVAQWEGSERASLADRLAAYMRKAAREAKLATSWTQPNDGYETALEVFVRGMLDDPRTGRAIEPFAEAVARHGFANTMSQTILKLTSPGVPDIYQGCELLDLSLVDPDNRRAVDYRHRGRWLDALEPALGSPDPSRFGEWLRSGDGRAKLYVIARLLRFRQAHGAVFAGGYRPLDAEGPASECVVAFAREAEDEVVLAVVPRFPATLARAGGLSETTLSLPGSLAYRTWTDVLTDVMVRGDETVRVADLPQPWAVLFSADQSP